MIQHRHDLQGAYCDDGHPVSPLPLSPPGAVDPEAEIQLSPLVIPSHVSPFSIAL